MEMEKVRFDTLRAEQERQAVAAKAATEKDEARKEAKRIKHVARKERKKVVLAELAGLAEELAAGRAAVTALAEIEEKPRPPPRSSRLSRIRHLLA